MNNLYLQTKVKKECNGCGICTLGCPTNAIKMVEDEEGFFYPQIDEDKCIKCNKCQNICSNYNNSKGNETAYMAINKEKEELKNSASGGMYYILAKYVIEKKGVVFGVEYGENLKVRHNYYETLEECKKFQGSKYVRSEIGTSYEKVKEFLNQDRYVLFTGTPCQCNALKTYLKKDYEKLILCDIICHANPSQKVFDKYVREIENIHKSKVIDIKFRDKVNGWKSSMPTIYFENHLPIKDQTFYRAFASELFNRPSCHECEFATSKRVTDFTIGDFWGISNILPDVKNDDTGISLLTVNSEKGKKIFEKVNSNMQTIEVDKELAFSYNHNCNIPPHKNRQQFFDNLDNKPIIENMQMCTKISFVKKVFRKLKHLSKKIVKKL